MDTKTRSLLPRALDKMPPQEIAEAREFDKHMGSHDDAYEMAARAQMRIYLLSGFLSLCLGWFALWGARSFGAIRPETYKYATIIISGLLSILGFPAVLTYVSTATRDYSFLRFSKNRL